MNACVAFSAWKVNPPPLYSTTVTPLHICIAQVSRSPERADNRRARSAQASMWSLQKTPEYKEVFEGPQAAEEARHQQSQQPQLSVAFKGGRDTSGS